MASLEGAEGALAPNPPKKFGGSEERTKRELDNRNLLLSAPPPLPHFALNRVLRRHFLENQDVAVKYKSEVINVRFL